MGVRQRKVNPDPALLVPIESPQVKVCTASDPFSGHGYSGNDGFSGTNTPDDAILFTVSGITVLVELFWKILMWI